MDKIEFDSNDLTNVDAKACKQALTGKLHTNMDLCLEQAKHKLDHCIRTRNMSTYWTIFSEQIEQAYFLTIPMGENDQIAHSGHGQINLR